MKISNLNDYVVKIGVSLSSNQPTLHATAFWLLIAGNPTLVTSAHVLWNLSPRNKLRQKVYIWFADKNSTDKTPYEVEIEVHPQNKICINKIFPDIDAAKIIPVEQTCLPPAKHVFTMSSSVINNGDGVLGIGYIDKVANISTMYARTTNVYPHTIGIIRNVVYEALGGGLPACSGAPFFKQVVTSSDWTSAGEIQTNEVIGTLNGRAHDPDKILIQSIQQYDW
ncbi:TPA: hypothetical protein NJ327_004450 [Vibrio parahaemolyticus]|nr:hypothetical protein [Vibrio parahaemolyticus]